MSARGRSPDRPAGRLAVRDAEGRGGLPAVVLEHPAGGRVEVSLHGGHVVSWTPSAGDDVLFLSREAVFAPDSAIRGGIPVIFPQFGEGPLPKHGFARTARWSLAERRTDDGVAIARLELGDTPETRRIWPHAFRLALTVALGDRLRVRLSVTNPGTAPFDFTAALHSYLRVADIGGARIEGLQGTSYLDKTAGFERCHETHHALGITEWVDRVYLDTPNRLVVRDEAGGRLIDLEQTAFPDTVVWNPWTKMAADLPDMAEDEYRAMLCVEAAAVGEPVSLAPGARWDGDQTIGIRPIA